MLPDRVSNPGLLTYESGALPIALRGPANRRKGSNEGLQRMFSLRNYPQYPVLSGALEILMDVLFNRISVISG